MRKTLPEKRICKICNTNSIEDKFHFLIKCPLYAEFHQKLYKSASESIHEFNNLTDEDTFVKMYTFKFQSLSIYLEKSWNIQKNNLFM